MSEPGYWGRMVNEDGTPHAGGLAYQLDDADAFEALWECYGMIWWLTDRLAYLDQMVVDGPDRSEVLETIEAARAGYQEGVRLGEGERQ